MPGRERYTSDPVQRAEYADLKGYLSNDVLVKVDRMSMAHALEVRCPLLDRRIIEFAFRVPVSRKMPKLQPKALLRGLAAGRLPDRIRTLPKHGFTAGPSAEQFRAEVLGGDARTASMVDRTHVARLFAEHRARRHDHGYALWAVWMLERWARQQKAPQNRSLIRTVGGAA